MVPSLGNEQVEPASSTFPMNQGFKCCYHCSWSGCTDAKAASEADGSRLVSELVLCMVPLVKFGDQKTSKLCSNSPNDPRIAIGAACTDAKATKLKLTVSALFLN